MPDIDATIWQEYQDQGVLVFGIHPGDPPEAVANFLEQTGITFPVLADEGTLFDFVFPSGVGYPYPRDVVIGKDLTVRSIKNSFNQAEMDSLVQALIAE
ncbi:MAG: redoxin domain-containing protein [Deltaproteobacteria bacterium]|nr:redoxin domain-containing protein [Deltaproteobacteria bacterium]